MARTLRDDMATDLYGVLLNEAEGAEWITYYPGDGSDARRILACVVEQSGVEQTEVIDYENEVLSVLVGSDESHLKGGVSRPAMSSVHVGATDTLVRDGDSDSGRYQFVGVSKRLVGGWVLRFERPRRTSYGKR